LDADHPPKRLTFARRSTKVTLGKQLAVTATGAAAVYVITYFFVPA